jgi:hypothetical protein
MTITEHQRIYGKSYRLINKNRIRKRNKLYEQKNAEKIAKRKHTYYCKNKQIISKKHSLYYYKNKDVIKIKHKTWRVNSYLENFTVDDWNNKKKKSKGVCLKKYGGCGKRVGYKNLTLDHNPPIFTIKPGYIYNINCINPVCRSCNSKLGHLPR